MKLGISLVSLVCALMFANYVGATDCTLAGSTVTCSNTDGYTQWIVGRSAHASRIIACAFYDSSWHLVGSTATYSTIPIKVIVNGDTNAETMSIQRTVFDNGGDCHFYAFSDYLPSATVDMFGGRGNDNINGSDNNDYLFGDEGGDTIHGYGGSDLIYGENSLSAGTEADYLYGDDGEDFIYGGGGDDDIYGGSDDDDLYGEDGNDEIWGSSGNDFINGGSGGDTLWGGSGDDIIWGYGGAVGEVDDLHGETGDDTLIANSKGVTEYCNGGVFDNDTCNCENEVNCDP
jgi:Ca2+-binding RTX toxin-like protein